MKKYLNTLFVTTQGAYLSKEGETVVVSVEQEKKLQIPVHTLSGVVCFGNVCLSPFVMGLCAERGVSISCCTEYGRFLASVQGETRGNVLLRREQYRLADDPVFSTRIAQMVLTGKINNCRQVLQRALRDHQPKFDGDGVSNVVSRLEQNLRALQAMDNLDSVRGVEGDSAHSYFSVFNQLIVSQKDHFGFDERNRRPPLDKVNCLLSFLYSLLFHDVRAALESVGLDSYVGFLHRDRPGRAGLALDIMEEFRPFLADRLVLSLINREQIGPKGFKQMENGAVMMDDDTRKTVLVAYQKRKQEEITHPYIGETAPIGLLFYLQALLLARFLRGDLDGYPPFLWK